MNLWDAAPARTGYHRIEADPPWPEHGGGGRGAQNHYRLLKTRGEILAAMRGARFADGKPAWLPHPTWCHLWLWVTDNYLPWGLWLMGELGFRYIRTAVWVKTRIGIGQYLRGQHELVLLGVRGETQLTRSGCPSVIGGRPLPHPTDASGRVIHSRKPEEALRMFEAVSPAPPGRALEMFARTDRPGVDSWGNETNALEVGQIALPLG